MNELREVNDEESVGESDNYRDDTLELEEGCTNVPLEHKNEVDGTSIVGEESGSLTPLTTINWTPSPVKI